MTDRITDFWGRRAPFGQKGRYASRRWSGQDRSTATEWDRVP